MIKNSTNDELYGVNFDNQIEQNNYKVIYFSEVLQDQAELLTAFTFVDNPDGTFPVNKECKLQFSVEYSPVSLCDYQFENYFGEQVLDYLDENIEFYKGTLYL